MRRTVGSNKSLTLVNGSINPMTRSKKCGKDCFRCVTVTKNLLDVLEQKRGKNPKHHKDTLCGLLEVAVKLDGFVRS